MRVPLLIALSLSTIGSAANADIPLVAEGERVSVFRADGVADSLGFVSLSPGASLVAHPSGEAGDAAVTARLRVRGLTGSGAAFTFHNNRFVFGAREGRVRFERGRRRVWDGVAKVSTLRDGEWFDFRFERVGKELRFSINGDVVLESTARRPQLGEIAFRSGTARLDLLAWAIDADVSWPVERIERRPPHDAVLFRPGDSGATICRIPALAVSPGGALLAFCEARRSGQSDDADTDVLLRRSTDGGETWTEPVVVAGDAGDDRVTIGNPTVVVDRVANRTVLFVCRNNRRVLVTRSADDGVSWSPLQEVSDHVTRPTWTWVATGPGAGVQLVHGAAKGRLIIPASRQDGGTEYDLEGPRRRTVVFYSDDHGDTWRIGGETAARTSEAAIAELPNGSLIMSQRNHLANPQRRVSLSGDGGLSWDESTAHMPVTDPECHASMVRWPDRPAEGEPAVLILSNLDSSRIRERMMVRLSRDDGRSWPIRVLIHEGRAGYSSLAVLPDGEIGLLYEASMSDGEDSIRIARFSVPWLAEFPGSSRDR